MKPRLITILAVALLFVLTAWTWFVPTSAAPAVPNDTLYEQFNRQSVISTYSTDRVTAADDNQDAEAADDFTVPPGVKWYVNSIQVLGEYSGDLRATEANVRFYSGDSLPTTVVSEHLHNGISGGFDTGNFNIFFTSTILTPGHYWVSVQANTDGQWRWLDRNEQAGEAAAWRNPGGGYGTTCQPDWGQRSQDCGYGNGSPDQIFRLVGAVEALDATPTETLVPTATYTATPTGSTPTPTLSPACIFVDVCSDNYWFGPVRDLVDRGAISGYTDNTFRPYNDATRSQVTKIVVIAQGWQVVTPATAHFSDVPTTNPFFSYVETAVEHGIISGYGDGTFKPFNNITRSQLTKVIVLARGWQLLTPAQPTFSDVPTTNPFYSQIETAVGRGIISGYEGGVFRPFNNATRAQISKIVYLAINQAPLTSK